MPDLDSKDQKELISSLPYSYDVSNCAEEIKEKFAEFSGKQVSVAGRITAIRRSGKLLFVDMLDSSGKLQIYFDYSVLGEKTFSEVKKLNAGDIVGVKGTVFKTKPGEISVNASQYVLLAKAMRPLPNKWQGLQNVELRYRNRHLDLIMNPEVRETFRTRSKVISLIRQFLESKGFIEFETPVIQPLYGGADAEPFRVRVNTLNEEHYLRIADELYLKRLIIGGFEKVYEIYKAFRNEDIDSTHSPEFTMVEWYQAYADYNDMMSLTEGLIAFIAKNLGIDKLVYRGKSIALKAPFERVGIVESINEKVGKDVLKLSDSELFALAEGHGIKFEKGKRNRPHAYDRLFSVLVQPELIQPTFVVDYPKEMSPLTRAKRGNPALTERFEIFIAGIELGNSYSELQNPVIQKENFEYETEKAKAGDAEAEPLDMDFVEAMEHGMPPTGGLGLGVDRLVMIFTDSASIKDVILFPMEKRSKRQ
jgi:lysyl-tRNA synthetase class 2